MWSHVGGAGALGKGCYWFLCPCGPDSVRAPPNTWAKNGYPSFLPNEAESLRWSEVPEEESWEWNSALGLQMPHSLCSPLWLHWLLDLESCAGSLSVIHTTHTSSRSWASESSLPTGSSLFYRGSYDSVPIWYSPMGARSTLTLVIFSGLEASQGSLLFYGDIQWITTSADVCTNHRQTRSDSLARIYSLFLIALPTFPSLLNSWGLHHFCRYIYGINVFFESINP